MMDKTIDVKAGGGRSLGKALYAELSKRTAGAFEARKAKGLGWVDMSLYGAVDERLPMDRQFSYEMSILREFVEFYTGPAETVEELLEKAMAHLDVRLKVEAEFAWQVAGMLLEVEAEVKA